jgi:hypothetical protein
MRRLLVSGFAALAVLLGLVLTTGVASAQGTTDPAPPACVPSAANHFCHTGNGGIHHGPIGGPGFPGHGVGGGHWIPGGNLPWGGPTLYGHQLWLQANLGLDICGFGNSYDTFTSRNLRYRGDIDRYLGRARWQSLYSSDCASSIAVVPNGLSLVNGQYLNLDLLGVQGGGLQSVCAFPSYDVFNSRLGGRFGNRWDSVRNRFGSNGFNEFRELRRQAHCTIVTVPSSTTIVQQPTTVTEAAPAPADPSTSGDDGASNPQPLASSPQALPAPAVAPNNGGDSLAWVFAHNRAV